MANQTSEVVRLNQKSKSFVIDERGSAYLDYLHSKLEIARLLAQDVDSLNEKCLTLGAGKMANMKILAAALL